MASSPTADVVMYTFRNPNSTFEFGLSENFIRVESPVPVSSKFALVYISPFEIGERDLRLSALVAAFVLQGLLVGKSKPSMPCEESAL